MASQDTKAHRGHVVVIYPWQHTDTQTLQPLGSLYLTDDMEVKRSLIRILAARLHFIVQGFVSFHYKYHQKYEKSRQAKARIHSVGREG